MRKTYLLCILLLFMLIQNTAAYTNEMNGYGGWEWGTPLDSVISSLRMYNYGYIGSSMTYLRKDDIKAKYVSSNAPVQYGFENDRFTFVLIELSGANEYQEMKAELIGRHGNPSKDESNIVSWIGDTTTIRLWVAQVAVNGKQTYYLEIFSSEKSKLLEKGMVPLNEVTKNTRHFNNEPLAWSYWEWGLKYEEAAESLKPLITQPSDPTIRSYTRTDVDNSYIGVNWTNAVYEFKNNEFGWVVLSASGRIEMLIAELQVEIKYGSPSLERTSGNIEKDYWIGDNTIIIATYDREKNQVQVQAGGYKYLEHLIPKSIEAESRKEEAVFKQTGGIELINGHYTAGIDFLPGRYDIEALSGVGNVYSTNIYSGGLNAIMGIVTKEVANAGVEQRYNNIELPKGTIITVGGVKVLLTPKEIYEQTLIPRNQKNKDSITLSNGHYYAGKDFPIGTYDIKALSGMGNVYCSEILTKGVNAIMGMREDDMYEGAYIKYYSNVLLDEGMRISINGVTIQLIPSK